MTTRCDYEDLHTLVDRLRPEQVRDLHTIALRLVEANESLDRS
ncbi:hypothetical protein [Microbispora sp. CA-102843]